MISFPLFKRNMLSSVKIGMIFVAVLTMYISIIIYMFDPELADILTQYQEVMPWVMSAMGMSGSTGTLIDFINTYLYGFIMIIIPMIFQIILINKLLMKYIDSGSMACLLASPNSRKKIIYTQMISILLSVFALILVGTIVGLAFSQAIFPKELDISKYIQLNISTVLLQFAISGIAFFAACFFNESKGFFALGAGLPIAFYLIQMLSNMGGDLDFLKYFTLFTLLPGEEIIAGTTGVLSSNLILAGIGIILYLSGSTIFIKKDLPI
jgi:ABC-2 type transport system permease protein